MDALSYTQWNPSILRKRIIINVNTHYKFSLVFVCDLWDYGNYQPSIAWPMPIMFIKSNKNRNVRTRVAFISLIKTSDNSIHHVVPCTFFPLFFLFHSLFYFSVFTKKKNAEKCCKFTLLGSWHSLCLPPLLAEAKVVELLWKVHLQLLKMIIDVKKETIKLECCGCRQGTATNLNSPIES